MSMSGDSSAARAGLSRLRTLVFGATSVLRLTTVSGSSGCDTMSCAPTRLMPPVTVPSALPTHVAAMASASIRAETSPSTSTRLIVTGVSPGVRQAVGSPTSIAPPSPTMPAQAPLVPSSLAMATSPSAPASMTSCPSRMVMSGSSLTTTSPWDPSFWATSAPVSTVIVELSTSRSRVRAEAWVANGAAMVGAATSSALIDAAVPASTSRRLVALIRLISPRVRWWSPSGRGVPPASYGRPGGLWGALQHTLGLDPVVPGAGDTRRGVPDRGDHQVGVEPVGQAQPDRLPAAEGRLGLEPVDRPPQRERSDPEDEHQRDEAPGSPCEPGADPAGRLHGIRGHDRPGAEEDDRAQELGPRDQQEVADLQRGRGAEPPRGQHRGQVLQALHAALRPAGPLPDQ